MNTQCLQLLFVFTVAIGFMGSWGCGAQSQQVDNGVIAVNYPQTLKLSVADPRLNAQFGLLPLKKVEVLHGSLCWVGFKGTTTPGADLEQEFVLQRIDLDGDKLAEVHNFTIASFGPAPRISMGYPVFGANKDTCLIRVLDKAYSDVGQYRLFSTNLLARASELQRGIMYLHYPLKVSPDGSKYAYAVSEPYNDAFYHLLVVNNGKLVSVSEKNISSDFSWTPRNTLLHSDYPKDIDIERNLGYPNIYENDLEGKVSLVKEGGYRPSMSPNGKQIAYFTAHTSAGASGSHVREHHFGGATVKNAALTIYDLDTQINVNITKVYERYPDLFWSNNGRALYVVENFYTFSKKTAFCRISVYDTVEKTYKLVNRIEQKGEASSPDDRLLLPYFTPIKIANDKYLICHVPIMPSVKSEYQVVAVNLETGELERLFSFIAPHDDYKIPLIDWIDR